MSTHADELGRDKADEFRNEHGLGRQPLGDLITMIEQTVGADVAVVDAPADEHGMTMRHRDRGTVFIAVARTERPMRQRSILAHELGHVLFGDWEVDRRAPANSWIETRATSFARHLLLPLDGVLETAETAQTRDQEAVLSRIVQRFLVSPAIAAIALEQVRFISNGAKTTFMYLTTPKLAARYGWSDQYHLLQEESRRSRAPQHLLTRAVTGYIENLVTARQLATLRGASAEELEQEYREAGIVPKEIEPSWGSPADLPQVEIDLTELDAELAAGEE